MISEKDMKTMDKFLELIIPDEFGTSDSDDLTSETRYLVETIDYDFPKVIYDNGVTKLVLVPDAADVVMKIPFCGSEDSYYDDNRDSDEDGYRRNEWTGFECALSEELFCEDNWDYCKEEVKIYELAKEWGVEKFFSKVEYFGKTFNNYPTYIQPKIQLMQNNNCNLRREEYYSRGKQFMSDFCYATNSRSSIDRKWIGIALEYYGEREVVKLINFLTEFEIEDLHSQNVGIDIKTSRPVIIDYCGWRD